MVPEAVPLIYSLHRPEPRLSVLARLVAAVISLLCLAVLVIATRLNPEPSGLETHLQLGLAPCSMLRTMGVPCIACGMTTSYAHLAHGQLGASLATQPAGTVFAFLTAMAVWIGGYVAATGRPSARLIHQVPIHRAMLALVAVAIVGWAYKLVVVWQQTRS